MKKAIIFTILCLLINVATAQVTLNTVITSSMGTFNFYVTKFSGAGQKYVLHAGNQIEIYNLNNTHFKTITIPSSITPTGFYIAYVSDLLFDLNPDIEYALATFGSGSVSMKVYIMDETGTQMLMCDSAGLGQANLKDPFLGSDAVFQTPNGAKLRIYKYPNTNGPFANKVQIYNLPGTLPCYECATGSGTVTGIAASNMEEGAGAVFFPNPATGQLRLKYDLPQGVSRATIRIIDGAGRMMEEVEVTDRFDHILLPASYNSGVYIYSIFVGDRLVTSRKIVLEN